MKFSLLQQRSCKAMFLALSSSMDVVALLTADGNLTLHRTLTWEKVLSKTSSDFGGQPTLISFSSTGKVLAVGGTCGLLCVLNIETCVITHAVVISKGDSMRNIISISWSLHSILKSPDADALFLRIGGTDLSSKAGIPELSEPGRDDSHDTENTYRVSSLGSEYRHIFEPINAQCENELETNHPKLYYSLLLSLSEDFIICGYFFGVFPLFSVNLSGQVDVTHKWCICDGVQSTGFSLYSSFTDLSVGHTENGFLSVPMQSILKNYDRRSRTAAIFMSLIDDTSRLSEISISLGRKWKDVTKVVTVKLGLLQSVLDAYQLPHNPVHFMYTVVLCGFWHPAALASFPQHWTAEGLDRLRSSVESTSNLIISTIVGKMNPIATNILLMSRELIAMYRAFSNIDDHSFGINKFLHSLVLSAEHLLYKIDETVSEARSSREAMLLYLQFIRECSTPPDLSELITLNKVELSMRPKLLRMFDPRVARADDSGRNAQAETVKIIHIHGFYIPILHTAFMYRFYQQVTGTYLYAYLQDQLLPAAIIASRREKNDYVDRVSGSINSNDSRSDMDTEERLVGIEDKERIFKDIFVLADELNRPDGSECVEEALRSCSLVTQIKHTKDIIESLYCAQHAKTTSDLQRVVEGSIDVESVGHKKIQLGYASSQKEVEIVSSNNISVRVMTIKVKDIGKILINEVQLHVFGFVGHISVLCRLEDEFSASRYYLADFFLDGLDGDTNTAMIIPSHVSFYEVSKSNAVYIVGLALASAISCEAQLFKFDINDMIFEEVFANSTSGDLLLFTLPEDTVQAILDKRKFLLSSPINSLTSCGARGIVSVIDESGKVLVFDMEDNDVSNDEDEEAESEDDG